MKILRVNLRKEVKLGRFTRGGFSQTPLLLLIQLKLRNRKHVPCFYRVIETRVEVWENEKCCGNMSR